MLVVGAGRGGVLPVADVAGGEGGGGQAVGGVHPEAQRHLVDALDLFLCFFGWLVGWSSLKMLARYIQPLIYPSIHINQSITSR